VAPFLCDDLFKLLKAIMKRFVKQTVLKEVTTAAKLTAVQLSKTENLLAYSKIDVGFEC
jgi:hypothetical protein